ncbi:hypothetical protein OG21DRAFT_319678 [Imleria badia]|nr:hypothetical protein OG21DRAFT_319678 [Imleria badia]
MQVLGWRPMVGVVFFFDLPFDIATSLQVLCVHASPFRILYWSARQRRVLKILDYRRLRLRALEQVERRPHESALSPCCVVAQPILLGRS